MDQSTGDETPTQKQARLRREKREAKIKAGGSARLDKISSVSGGRVAENLPQPASITPQTSAFHPDPAEVDLSTHPSATDHPPLTPAQLRNLLSSTSPSIPYSNSEATSTFPQNAQDPMANMLQQLLSGANGSSSGNDPFGLPMPSNGSLPSALASLLSGVNGNGNGIGNDSGSSAPSQPSSRLPTLFRALHLFAALAFAMLILYAAPTYNGSLSARAPHLSAAASARASQAFWGFVATEIALLSGRAWAEGRGLGSGRGRGGGAGMMVGLVAGFLPGIWGQVVRSGMWYLSVVRKGVEDAMVVVFVLGLLAWWRHGG